jgi:hypothetical protein
VIGNYFFIETFRARKESKLSDSVFISDGETVLNAVTLFKISNTSEYARIFLGEI